MATIRQQYKMAILSGYLAVPEARLSEALLAEVSSFADYLIKEDQEHEAKTTVSEDDGYYYLKDGDMIEKGDEFKDDHTGEWNPVNEYAIGRVCTEKLLPPMRRKIK